MQAMPVLSNQNWEKFCQCLVESMPAADAFAAAFGRGIKGADGKRDPSVYSDAWRLRQRPEVKERIAELMNIAAERALVTRERIIREQATIAFADPRMAIDPETGGVRRVDDLPEDVAGAASSVKVDERGGVEIKFWSKARALDALSKMLGLYEADNRQAGDSLKEFLREMHRTVMGTEVRPGGLQFPDDGEEE